MLFAGGHWKGKHVDRSNETRRSERSHDSRKELARNQQCRLRAMQSLRRCQALERHTKPVPVGYHLHVRLGFTTTSLPWFWIIQLEEFSKSSDYSVQADAVVVIIADGGRSCCLGGCWCRRHLGTLAFLPCTVSLLVWNVSQRTWRCFDTSSITKERPIG